MPLLDIDYADATRYAELLGIVRIAIGLAAWAVPDRITEPWVGPTVDRDTRTVLTRALGGRDIALGLGALLAARRHRGARGWVEAGGLADAGDLLASLIGYRGLPRWTRLGIVALTAGAVAAAAVVAPALSEG